MCTAHSRIVGICRRPGVYDSLTLLYRSQSEAESVDQFRPLYTMGSELGLASVVYVRNIGEQM